MSENAVKKVVEAVGAAAEAGAAAKGPPLPKFKPINKKAGTVKKKQGPPLPKFKPINKKAGTVKKKTTAAPKRRQAAPAMDLSHRSKEDLQAFCLAQKIRIEPTYTKEKLENLIQRWAKTGYTNPKRASAKPPKAPKAPKLTKSGKPRKTRSDKGKTHKSRPNRVARIYYGPKEK